MKELSEIISHSIGGYSIANILSAILTLLVCLVVVRLVMKLFSRLLSRASRISDRLQKIILSCLKVLLYVLTAIITAESLGINTASLTAIMSVLTLGVTLAAEDILGNVAGGLVILSSHPFGIGDTIEAGGTVGTVREISLNHTKLETADGQIVLQPNRALSSSKIINYTTLGRRRVVRTVTASYDAPTDTVKAACMDAARERLGAAGYHPYEVASYALDGHECAHNIAYWTGQGYLGLGRSAAGMLDAGDFDRLAGLFPDVPARGEAYRVRLVQRDDTATTFDAEYLSQREAAAEDLMLACRMTRGIGPDLLVRSASVIAADKLAAACDRALELGLATWVPDHVEGLSGRVASKDVIAGRARARLAPTHLGWLDGNVLFELFWGLA